ncbi:MAG: Two component transcriptional regulator, LuxR family [Firmicutes bacterium]|nr:Two component transcriptional regulator, LuxR family [Bacillota bacterium]
MRVLLADDHCLFSSGLQKLLEASGITVVDTVKNGFAAIESVRNYQPDVVLMDLEMPECDGLKATQFIKTEFPAIKIVILTMNVDERVFSAIKNGASGYLLKNLEIGELLTLLESLEQGQTIFSPELANWLLQEFDTNDIGEAFELAETVSHVHSPLTSRQKEILLHIASGKTYKEVGAICNITVATVKFHINEILERLHLKNRAQAIAYAIQANLVSDTNKK